MCSSGVTVAKDDVMKPVWNNAVSVHQVPDCLQHGLEVVLFWLSSQNYVERIIHVLKYAQHIIKSFQKCSIVNQLCVMYIHKCIQIIRDRYINVLTIKNNIELYSIILNECPCMDVN